MAAPIPRVPPVTKATRPLSLSPVRPAVFSFWVRSRTGVGEVMGSPHTRGGRALRVHAAPTRCVVNRDGFRSAGTSWQIPTAESNGVQSPFVRLPIFYGWVVVAVAFVTMGVGINARTAFSVLFPPILTEFGWERGMTAGAFSFGFLVSALLSPWVGRLMDRRGPRVVIEMGVALMTAGLLLAPLVHQPWHLYVTLGVLVSSGTNCLSYTGQSLFLPNWFVRRRGLAMSVAFSGVGIGSIILLPWLQSLIGRTGWRA